MKAKAWRLLPSSLKARRVNTAYTGCMPYELCAKRVRFLVGICVHVCDTNQVNESPHNTQPSEWRAFTQEMRAGAVYPTPILSISNNLSSNHSLVLRQAEWMWALSLQTNGVTCHFHLLAYSCKQSLYAFKQRWHLIDANDNSYCADWKLPRQLCA